MADGQTVYNKAMSTILPSRKQSPRTTGSSGSPGPISDLLNVDADSEIKILNINGLLMDLQIPSTHTFSLEMNIKSDIMS